MTTAPDHVSTEAARPGRLPRSERRAQLLEAAQDIFVESGYHSAAMDAIAERAGVSKPVLYQHFPSKKDLYLALLDQHCTAIVDLVREALGSTDDNRARVAATIAAYFEFFDRDGAPFRLVFQSDLTGEPAVRERLDRVETEDQRVLAGQRGVPADHVGDPGDGAGRRRTELRPPLGHQQLRDGRDPDRGQPTGGHALVAGDRRLPQGGRPRRGRHRLTGNTPTRPAVGHGRERPARPPAPTTTKGPSVEVKIGVQNVAREITFESAQSPEQVSEAVATAVRDGSGGIADLIQ